MSDYKIIMDKERIRTMQKIQREHPASYECIKRQGALEELEKEHKFIGNCLEIFFELSDEYVPLHNKLVERNDLIEKLIVDLKGECEK